MFVEFYERKQPQTENYIEKKSKHTLCSFPVKLCENKE